MDLYCISYYTSYYMSSPSCIEEEEERTKRTEREERRRRREKERKKEDQKCPRELPLKKEKALEIWDSPLANHLDFSYSFLIFLVPVLVA